MTKADIYPALVDSARKQYAEQNHPYNLTHRGYSALPPEGRRITRTASIGSGNDNKGQT